MHADLHDIIHPHIRAWGTHGIHFGLSSWTAPEWRELLGHQRYAAAENGVLRALAAYATVFRTTAITTAALGTLAPPVLSRLGDTVPENFSFVVVVENGLTTYRFPHCYPDRLKRGQRSAEFCDPSAFAGVVIPLLEQIAPRVHTVLFRFPTVFPTEELRALEFAGLLGRLLDACPSRYRYAVEIGTPHGMTPWSAECLRAHAAATALRQTEEESLLENVLAPGALSADRLFLRVPADAAWSSGEGGLAVREAIRRCVDAGVELHVHLDPPRRPAATVGEYFRSLMEMLMPDLAKLSPIRRRVAA
jgi:uncharacterized protein YecE (DUF72 family)